MKLQILQVDLNLNFPIIAFASPLKGYEVAWHIEHHAHLTLFRKEDIRIFAKNNRYISFDRFDAQFQPDEYDEPCFILIANKVEKELFIPVAEYEWVDFYIRFNEETNPSFIESVKNTLSLHAYINQVHQLNSSNIKHSERFVL